MLSFLIFLQDYYNWILSFHIIAVLFWMAGLYYLPRLFVYHTENFDKPDLHATFLTMEHKLLRVIMLPSMAVAWLFGLLLVAHNVLINGWYFWLITKILLVLVLSGYHGFLVRTHRSFQEGVAPYSGRFFRAINELPPLLTIIIVLLVIFKP